MRPLTVSLFDGCTATAAYHHTLALRELVQRLEPRGTQKDGPAICGAVFDPAVRKKAHVREVHALILDIDEAEGTIAELTRPLVDYEAILWTTWSHTDDKHPKFRHLLPLARPVDVDEYAALWSHVNDLLGGIVDRATRDASRLQYLPRETGASGEPAWVYHHDAARGKAGWLDPDALPGGGNVAELVEQQAERTRPSETLEVDRDELISALDAIPVARCSFDQWLEVGMALHHEGISCDVWDRWSSGDPERYEAGECQSRWETFEHGGGTTAGTIYHLAREHGWSRPFVARQWDLDDLAFGDEPIIYQGRNESIVTEHVLAAHQTSQPVIYDLAQFWRWDGVVWQELPEQCLAMTLHDWQRREHMRMAPTEKYPDGRPYILSPAQQKSVISHAKIPAAQHDFFAGAPSGIAFADRFIQVQGRKIVETANGPEQRQRHAYAWNYDPHADATQTEQAVREILQGVNQADTEDRVRLWWQFCGAAIMGIAPRFLRAMVLQGRKGCGKSQLGELLDSVMPPGSSDAISPHDFGDDKKAIAFRSMRLNFVGELRHERPISNHTIVKSVIGGELVTARDVYQPKVTFRPTAAHLWCANRLPQVPGVDGSWWDRIMMIECRQQFRGTGREKKQLAARLVAQELPGIVRLAIDGARDLLEMNGYSIPLSSELAVSAWMGSADSVSLFLDEACEECAGIPASKWATPTEVHEAFLKWVGVRKHQEMSHHELLERILSRGIEKKRSNGARLALRILPVSSWREPTYDEEFAPF